MAVVKQVYNNRGEIVKKVYSNGMEALRTQRGNTVYWKRRKTFFACDSFERANRIMWQATKFSVVMVLLLSILQFLGFA